MPILILLVGVLLVVVGINDKMGDLGALVKEDFAPTNNAAPFHVWIAVIFIIGSLGYVKSFKPVANGFLVLVILVLILKSGNPNNTGGGLFATFNRALRGN